MFVDLCGFLSGRCLVRAQFIGRRRCRQLLLGTTLAIPTAVMKHTVIRTLSRHSPYFCREQEMEVTFVLPEQPDCLITLVFGGHGARRSKEVLYTLTVVELWTE